MVKKVSCSIGNDIKSFGSSIQAQHEAETHAIGPVTYETLLAQILLHNVDRPAQDILPIGGFLDQNVAWD